MIFENLNDFKFIITKTLLELNNTTVMCVDNTYKFEGKRIMVYYFIIVVN